MAELCPKPITVAPFFAMADAAGLTQTVTIVRYWLAALPHEKFATSRRRTRDPACQAVAQQLTFGPNESKKLRQRLVIAGTSPKTDAVDQICETRVAAQRVKQRVYLY